MTNAQLIDLMPPSMKQLAEESYGVVKVNRKYDEQSQTYECDLVLQLDTDTENMVWIDGRLNGEEIWVEVPIFVDGEVGKMLWHIFQEYEKGLSHE